MQNLLEQARTDVLAVRIGNFHAKISPRHKLMSATREGTDETEHGQFLNQSPPANWLWHSGALFLKIRGCAFLP